MTPKEISKEIGCSLENVYRVIRLAGVKKNKFGCYDLNKNEVAKIKKMMTGPGRPKGAKNKKN